MINVPFICSRPTVPPAGCVCIFGTLPRPIGMETSKPGLLYTSLRMASVHVLPADRRIALASAGVKVAGWVKAGEVRPFLFARPKFDNAGTDFLATTIRSTRNYTDFAMGAWASNREKGIRNYFLFACTCLEAYYVLRADGMTE